MKSEQLLNFLKTEYLTVPFYLFKIKNILNIDSDTFIVLIYLINKQSNVFDPKAMASDLNISLENVMLYIDNLSSKKILNVEVKKNDKGMLEEVVNMDLFYDKVNMLLIENINESKKEKTETKIYQKFEQELGRCLSPMEYEFINAWLSSGTSEEIVIEALKEAVMNGATSFKYIDKIIYEWGKKGYKTVADVNKGKMDYRKYKEEKRPKKEVFDYNWLEDNDDEQV